MRTATGSAHRFSPVESLSPATRMQRRLRAVYREIQGVNTTHLGMNASGIRDAASERQDIPLSTRIEHPEASGSRMVGTRQGGQETSGNGESSPGANQAVPTPQHTPAELQQESTSLAQADAQGQASTSVRPHTIFLTPEESDAIMIYMALNSDLEELRMTVPDHFLPPTV